MRRSKRAFWGAAFAAALALERPARADDITDARGHFAEGVRHFIDGDFEGARRLFVQAEREHHAPIIVYNLARSEERLGRPQGAVEDYERYLAEEGAKGEFAEAAAIAVADLRARSSNVRIESTPTGARAYVDGSPVHNPTPATVLLPPGAHHVVVEGDTWRASGDFEAVAGREQTVRVDRAEPAAPPIPARPAQAAEATASPRPPPPSPQPPPPPPRPPAPDGFVFGAAFVVGPYGFFGAARPMDRTTGNDATNNGKAQIGVESTVMGEAGYAFAPRAEIVLRGFAGLGSTCATVLDSHILAGGPAINYRATNAFWIGASVLGGTAATCRGQSNVPNYDTGRVLTPSVDFAYAIITHSYGQWLVTASVMQFFATVNNNMLLYVPVGLAVRFF